MNSRETRHEPSDEVDVIFFRLLTLTSAFSMGVVTVFSTDSGPAFVYVAEIMRYGLSTSGKRLMERFPKVNMPIVPSSAKMISIRMGCWSVFWLIMNPSSRCRPGVLRTCLQAAFRPPDSHPAACRPAA